MSEKDLMFQTKFQRAAAHRIYVFWTCWRMINSDISTCSLCEISDLRICKSEHILKNRKRLDLIGGENGLFRRECAVSDISGQCIVECYCVLQCVAVHCSV